MCPGIQIILGNFTTPPSAATWLASFETAYQNLRGHSYTGPIGGDTYCWYNADGCKNDIDAYAQLAGNRSLVIAESGIFYANPGELTELLGYARQKGYPIAIFGNRVADGSYGDPRWDTLGLIEYSPVSPPDLTAIGLEFQAFASSLP